MRKSIHSGEYREFCRLLREARKRAGLTQEELAERLDESQSFISKCERGERRLDVIEALEWCSALGVSFRGLVGRLERAVR